MSEYIWLYPQIDEKGKIQSRYVDYLQFQSDYQYINATRRFEILCEKVVSLLNKSKDDYEFWQSLGVPAYVEFVSLKVKNIDNKNTFVDLIDKNGNVYTDLFHFSFWCVQGVSTVDEKWNNEQKFYTTPSKFFVMCDFYLQLFVDTDYSFVGVEPLAYYTKSVVDDKIEVVDSKFQNYYNKVYIDTELKKLDDKIILLSNVIGSSSDVSGCLSTISSLVSKIDVFIDSISQSDQNNNITLDSVQFAELKSLLQGIAVLGVGK